MKVSELYFTVNFLQLFLSFVKDTFTKGLSYVFNSKSNDIDFLIAELIRTRLITPMLVYKINLL